MRRQEFTKATKRAALERSGGRCEAVGRVYGFLPRMRCNAQLSYGVEFDHYPVLAVDGGTNDLDNCMAVCRKCHRWKTNNVDIPQLAKGQRIKDKIAGVTIIYGFSTNRNGPYRKRLNGKIEER